MENKEKSLAMEKVGKSTAAIAVVGIVVTVCGAPFVGVGIIGGGILYGLAATLHVALKK